MIKYKAFVEVVEQGNFTKAAKRMGYSQPGISHMIDALEKEFGFPLLHRNNKTVTPTEDGKKVLQYCYRLVQDEKELLEMVDAINGLMTGTIRIGALNSMAIRFLPEAIINFTNAFRGIDVLLKEYSIQGGCDALTNGNVDLFFGTDQIPEGFEFIPLFQDPICLIMHEDHPFTACEKLPVDFLKSCDFIMPEAGWDDLAIPLLDAIDTTPVIRHYTASETASIALVSKGMGVFPLSKQQTYLLPENVTFCEFKEGFNRNMGISLRSLKTAPPAQKEFVQFAKATAEKYIKTL